MVCARWSCRFPINQNVRHAIILGIGLLLSGLWDSGARADTLLTVEAAGVLPGFQLNEVESYLAGRLAQSQLPGWRFQGDEARASGTAPNRIVWRFIPNPFAGGNTRYIGPPGRASQRFFGVRRYLTIEVRLYLNGAYQTLTSAQAEVVGGQGAEQLNAIVDQLTKTVIDDGTMPAAKPHDNS